MEINSWPGLIAVILAIISFYGTTYLVIALNTGWRFGYWLSSACFGALMVLLSIFWSVNVRTDQAVGPQGELPHWIPVAVGDDVAQATYEGEALEGVGQYPGGTWEQPEEGDERVDAFTSAVQNCVTVGEEEMCKDAQETLMPTDKDVPVLEGVAVPVIAKVDDLRFSDEGSVLGQAVIRPITTDPRVSKDPDGEPLADEFRVVAILDKGSVGLPSYMSLVIFAIYTAFHLWGLNRAEKRKLNPAVV